MKEKILCELEKIEKENSVRVLLAVEAGSRAWGFESPDSDFDVRFIYVRRAEDYLMLEEPRDVIEFPVNGLLDVNGWDLRKALRLLRKSNPTLFEWFSSPIVYRRDEPFCEKFLPLLNGYFSSKSGLHHYLSMASGNYREFLRGDTVKAKKYFYVLRPVLACKWILSRGTPPPMRFSDLCAAELPPALREDVEKLLEIKMNSPEIKLIPRVDSLNRYLDESIESVQRALSGLPPEPERSPAPLNALFLETLYQKKQP